MAYPRRRFWAVWPLLAMLLIMGCAPAATAPAVAPTLAPTAAPAATATSAAATPTTPSTPVATTAAATATTSTSPVGPTATAVAPTATPGAASVATPTSAATAPPSTAAPTATIVAAPKPGTGPTPETATFSPTEAYRHVVALATTIGIRAAGTEGEAKGADYIANQLASYGYSVTRHRFPISRFRDNGTTLTLQPPEGGRLTPAPLQFSGSATITGGLLMAGSGASSDFAGRSFNSKIALIERGGNTFREKTVNARNAGAIAVIIYNNVDGPFQGSLAEPINLPVVGLPRDQGLRLRQLLQAGPVEVALKVDVTTDQTPSQNVVAVHAGAPAGRPIIVVGGHFDSVPAGPGANDNASGTAVMLEMARVLAREQRVELRFIAFGAEELGLLGSRAYATQLSEEERKRTIAMINLDMLAVGSPLVISGSDDLTERATAIAKELGVTSLGRSSGGRIGGSDHSSFMAVGIPAVFFNRPNDPNYHTPEDKAEFVSQEALAIAGQISLRLIDQLISRA